MEHYYSRQQESVFRPKRINVSLLGLNLSFYTAKGVFSSSRLDKGSGLLVEATYASGLLKKGGELLDLGCGWGAVGIISAALCPGISVTFSDVNERALKLSRMNLKLNRIENAAVRASDSFDALQGRMFDTILFNPPQKAGRKVCFRMITESSGHLKPGGAILVVAQHNKGGRVLKSHIRGVFGEARDLCKSGGFRVYMARKRK